MEEVRRNRQPVGIGTQKRKSALAADQEGLGEFLLLPLILIRRLEKRFLHPLWNLTSRTHGVKEVHNFNLYNFLIIGVVGHKGRGSTLRERSSL